VGYSGTDEAHSHGTNFLSMIAAAKHMWGDHALSDVAQRLKPETRRTTLEGPVLAVSWYPSRMLVDWCESIWNGPARQREAIFATFVDRSIDLGWSRMRRLLVGMLNPELLATRAAMEWRKQHSHGTAATVLTGHGATATFSDTPFIDAPLMQRVLAEGFRHVASLSRVHVVREDHRVEAGRLVVDLMWR
jgi:hypothetical protein